MSQNGLQEIAFYQNLSNGQLVISITLITNRGKSVLYSKGIS